MGKLASKYRVAVIDERNEPYKLSLKSGRLITPTLDTYIDYYEWINEKVFSHADIAPGRLGIIFSSGLNFIDSFLPCVLVSWAQSHVRSRVSLDMLPPNERFCRLAVDCLLKTKDDMYILARRSQKVSEYKGYWDVSAAGWVDVEQFIATENLQDQIIRELYEEIGLGWDQIVKINQLGLCLNPMPEYSMAEVCFEAETDLEADIVLALSKGAKDSWEGKHSAFSGLDLFSILNSELVKPAAAATIMLTLGLPFTEEL